MVSVLFRDTIKSSCVDVEVDAWCMWWSLGIPTGAFLLIEVPLFADFVLSLQVAAALASDSVLEVVHAVVNTPPTDEKAWATNVVKPALELPLGAVGQLSQGWGRGLALAYGGLWTMSIGMCCMIILAITRGWASAYHLFPFTMLMMLGVPLFMSKSVAEVSTSCDDLCSSINGRRLEDLSLGPRMHQLELALGNLHHGQGLGFSTADTVIDKKKLRTMYISVIGAFSTIVPLLLAFFAEKMEVLRYGSFTTGDSVFAYSPTMRNYADSTQFCESLWMQPASFDSLEQIEGVLKLIEPELTTYVYNCVPARPQ